LHGETVPDLHIVSCSVWLFIDALHTGRSFITVGFGTGELSFLLEASALLLVLTLGVSFCFSDTADFDAVDFELDAALGGGLGFAGSGTGGLPDNLDADFKGILVLALVANLRLVLGLSILLLVVFGLGDLLSMLDFRNPEA